MADKIPRRMRRFYREKKTETKIKPKETDFSKYDDPEGLPSMDYEDVGKDNKNHEEMKKIEELNLEEKLALMEVKKFKEEKKRLPNKEEAEKIAGNIYEQIRKNPELFGISKEETGRSRGREKRSEREEKKPRDRRGRRNREEKKEPSKKEETTLEEPAIGKDMKELLSEENKSTKKDSFKKIKDDFDIGLDLKEDLEEDANELEEISDEEESKCPKCGKKSDKIIFCAGCGIAYCEKCAKEKKGKNYTCPECGKENEI